MKPRIGLVGAGHVGATIASLLLLFERADIELIDIVEGLPQGLALDMGQMAACLGLPGRIRGGNDMAALEGADIVVVTAGVARKPGMSRDDLVEINAGVIASVARDTARYAPDSTLIIVTNPLDIMTYHAWKVSGFPSSRVCGMAGVLDTARFKAFLAWETGVSPAGIESMVLGGHGDQMVPLVDQTVISGAPVTDLLAADKLDAVAQRTRDGGAEIVGHLKTASAYYAPAAATAEMVRAVLNREDRVLPVCAYADGFFGLEDIYIGVPAVLGGGGVRRIVPITLTPAQAESLKSSAAACRQVLKTLGY